ncbi:MAG: hypothetical protein V1723_00025 [Candidatus Uhrbacteria bacterium]
MRTEAPFFGGASVAFSASGGSAEGGQLERLAFRSLLRYVEASPL